MSETYVLLAKAQIQRGDTPHLIIKTLREGIKHHPDNAELHELLSQALLRRGDTYEALMAANKAVKFAPNSIGGYIARARAYIKQDKPTEAIADIQKALEIDPENQEAREILSRLEQQNTLESPLLGE